jgi:hypothetical protein
MVVRLFYYMDPFEQNIAGVSNLVNSGTNKVDVSELALDPIGDLVDTYSLDMSDEQLLSLKNEWLALDAPYSAKIKPRQERNKLYYAGLQGASGEQNSLPVASNLLFEATETFIPQALAKNPEPVVWSDNTPEGKDESNDIKTMLQYHADTLVLNRTLAIAIRHWNTYFVGIIKHGWDSKAKDITLRIRNPKNFIFDPDAYVDVKGNYVGLFLGEHIESTAKDLIEMFPDSKEYIQLKVNDKLGTTVTRIEWWTDEYCFSTFADEVLDKHKNEFFNYEKKEEGIDESGEPTETATPGRNHFEHAKMPYTFLSVFSLEETPHDITNLVEQNIANQQRIVARDNQIDKNLRYGNNAIAVSGVSFNQETARQAATALEDGDPVLVPDGRVNEAIMRIPANALPTGVIEAQQVAKDALRGVFGVQGLAAQPQTADTTARGMILNQSHDSSRIGGGIGDALEQVADNIFNWWLQMYYVFYDEAHYGAIMGSGQAVEYVQLIMSNSNRQFVVSVSPNSMAPKDEITEQNQALDLWKSEAIDPITLFKKLNYPDPMETAKMAALWVTNPQGYMATYFPEQAPQAPQAPPNPPGVAGPISADQTGQTLAQPPANPGLGQVPINQTPQ